MIATARELMELMNSNGVASDNELRAVDQLIQLQIAESLQAIADAISDKAEVAA